MLAQINIKDFAIIDDISIDFKEGLTVLTGETGAGKSIIIDAIQLLAGARASVEFVRHKAEQANIEGIFFIDEPDHHVYEVLNQFDLPVDEEGSIILQRQITAKGKSICRVNGKLITLGILKEIGQTIIDIHSQHETQSLMQSEKHIQLLDQFDQTTIQESMQSYDELFGEYSRLKQRFKDLSENEQEIAQRIDLLKFQLSELQEIKLEVGEDEQLEEERHKLANFERIYDGLQTTYYSLYGENKGLDFLGHAMTSLEQLEDVDETFRSLSEQLKSNFYAIEELSFDLRNRLDEMEFQPDRLNEIEKRLHEINRLKRKYGKSVEEIVNMMIHMEEELEQLENKDTHLQALEKQIIEVEKDTLMEAEQLHRIRTSISQKLKTAIQQELMDLYLEKASFNVSFSTVSGDVRWKDSSVKLLKNGMDQVQFMISTNPGEPEKPLQKVASGGEISRIMLALKRIFSEHQNVTSVIFDEVDTGVSGRVAQAIAQKIHDISKQSQVLCITHLPQVAAMSDQHLLIEKDQDNKSTTTNVKQLSQNEAVEEIGRMISGTEVTDTTKQHAEELIQQAKSVKS
ncbi:DNA repair protein RecN [Tenuibacillus multivorans]|uniref:DNA repair protein RecN n=1 Tax=Tenuibacillus multivorans TaxID=237069 RepID=A0A1G9Z7Y4_9BACI|nr:DNA repair protein RecN [Tenuibacillus multivorans]GEL77380.1 DNA repair protein RecN [Tenuibacillus multivorans]SDN16931.1 DNA repair protein RecN (Recombination protein N) [Tenuibacillus multivorans]